MDRSVPNSSIGAIAEILAAGYRRYWALTGAQGQIINKSDNYDLIYLELSSRGGEYCSTGTAANHSGERL